MIIEVVGLPGAGKTFIVKYKFGPNGAVKISLSGRMERYWRSLAFFVGHPKIFFYFTKLIFKETRRNLRLLKHKYLYLFLGALAREQKSHRYAKLSRCVIDEGIFEFLFFSLKESGSLSISEANSYISRLNSLPRRKMIFVKVDKPIRISRMKNRKRFPRSDFGEEYLVRYHKIIEQNAIILEGILKNNNNATIVRNDSGDLTFSYLKEKLE